MFQLNLYLLKFLSVLTHFSYVIGIFFLFFSSSYAKTMNYIEGNTPINELMIFNMTMARSFSPEDDKQAVSLPVITWGGDIATILANGNSLETKSGSYFDTKGLLFKLRHENNFISQVLSYKQGDTPYLRGTLGMINMAANAFTQDSLAIAKPIVIYQETWSNGADAIIVRKNSGIKKVADLKGKTIAIQAYGPHVAFLFKVLSDAGLKPDDVTIKWTQELSGAGMDNPASAMRHDNTIDAATVIIPDALELSKNNTATILIDTKAANRTITDVYAVRADYLEQNPKKVENFVKALIQASEQLNKIWPDKNSAAYKEIKQSASSILKEPDVEGLYADCQFVGFQGNRDFFENAQTIRNYPRLVKQIQSSLLAVGTLQDQLTLSAKKWDYSKIKNDLSMNFEVEATSFFDESKIIESVELSSQSGELNSLFEFEIYYDANQTTFDSNKYQAQFNTAIERAATYQGATITIDGHAGIERYTQTTELKNKKQIYQRALSLSYQRAAAIKAALLHYAKTKNTPIDPKQLTVRGLGISEPKFFNACSSDPFLGLCNPKSSPQMKLAQNRRAVFRLIPLANLFNF